MMATSQRFNHGAGSGAGDSLDHLKQTMAANDAVPAAGKVWDLGDEGTASCLEFPEVAPPTGLAGEWYKNSQPGVRVCHPGMRNPKATTDRTYGVSTLASEHVDVVIKQEPQTVLEQMLRRHGEKEYKSVKEEPLGKSRIHSGTLPARVTGEGYAFGVKTSTSQAAKELLYPADDEGESKVPAYTARYRGVQGPGEQRTRGYKWEKTSIKDPKNHRFGMRDPTSLRDGEGAALALHPEQDAEVPRRSIVPKRVADFQAATKDNLGKTRGGGGDEDQVFGKTTTGDQWTAADCIRGDYALEQQLPDADLGKSVSKGFRNLTTDADRTFGLPTIRTDIPERKASVADHQNYGNDADAGSLLHPSRFVDIGVDHRDFTESRSANEIRALFAKIGYSLDDDEFAQIYNRAANHYDLNSNGIVSVEEFRLALNEYDDAQAEGRVPEWFKA